LKLQATPEALVAGITIIGAGKMGTVLGELAATAGYDVELLGRADADRPVTGDLVVLAVPYPAIADVLAARTGQLDGKVVVDITNPIDFATFDGYLVPADGSATAEIAAALPGARVVKAFNTTYEGHLATGRVGDEPTTVLIAGDDDAKAQVSAWVTAAGLRAADAGSLDRARELEALCFLQMALSARGVTSWAGGFALVP
jgi:predicted dinucleotide-binding enzyme